MPLEGVSSRVPGPPCQSSRVPTLGDQPRGADATAKGEETDNEFSSSGATSVVSRRIELLGRVSARMQTAHGSHQCDRHQSWHTGRRVGRMVAGKSNTIGAPQMSFHGNHVEYLF